MEVITGGAVACPLESACTFALVGPSRSGKSQTIRKIIQYKDAVFTSPIHTVLYCYNVWSDDFNAIEGVTFLKGMPSRADIEKLTASRLHSLLILDDLAEALQKNAFATELFTAYSHHFNMSIGVTLHNLFTPHTRTITLNLLYFFLYKNPRDTEQVKLLGRQLGMRSVLTQAYNDMDAQYQYIVVDMTGRCSEKLRIRRNIFPDENMISFG